MATQTGERSLRLQTHGKLARKLRAKPGDEVGTGSKKRVQSAQREAILRPTENDPHFQCASASIDQEGATPQSSCRSDPGVGRGAAAAIFNDVQPSITRIARKTGGPCRLKTRRNDPTFSRMETLDKITGRTKMDE
jgi:hypothetical protein